jgi:hypothetical protein
VPGVTIKPMTYLVSFTLFVLMFMGLGGYVAYGKFADHLLTQAYLEATPVNVHVFGDRQGMGLRWEDGVSLQNGASARITATDRSFQISIEYSDEPGPRALPLSPSDALALTAGQRIEDIRIDKNARHLYARVCSASSIQSKETTWIYKYDLQRRRLLRRASANPVILPAPFRP